MRNDIALATSAIITGTGSNGYSLNAIDITFDLLVANNIQVVSCRFNNSNGFDVTFSGLDTSTAYELHYSPDLETAFTLIPGTSKAPGTATDTFTDPSPITPGKGFYQLFVSP